jgi:hypothetical protein
MKNRYETATNSLEAEAHLHAARPTKAVHIDFPQGTEAKKPERQHNVNDRGLPHR